MGQQQSKDELVYQQVMYNKVEGIKSLCREGARLEWIDKEGKTPLIAACMNPELHNVAETLIGLGANVNAYRPGRHAGTPLHHAAKRGLENTVRLLLSRGANALVMNDDCQTPLDVARAKGFTNVVRAIESHVCLFSGWLRELYGPGFLERLAPQLVSRKVWVVVLPCGSRNLTTPLKLELAVYSTAQDALPRIIMALWKANMEDPKFHQYDPTVMIIHNATKTRIKLASATENDNQQLELFCNACKGIVQVNTQPTFLQNTHNPVSIATAPPAAEDVELAMSIDISVQSAMERPPFFGTHPNSEDSASTSNTNQGSLGDSEKFENTPSGKIGESRIIPSAPLIDNEVIDDGPISYPSIDSSPIDLSSTNVGNLPNKKNEDGDTTSCVICLDAPVEGACIPCGHMAGCMSCLTEIKGKKWGCPVCRAKIEQVVRLYAV